MLKMGLKQDIESQNSFNIWRIVFTCVIMTFHFFDATTVYTDYPVIKYHWYIAVEFFFILSGFLMAGHMDHNPNETVLQYMKKRIIRLYPVYIFAFLVIAVIKSYVSGLNILKIVIPNWLEVFMLQSIGTNRFPYVNNPAWYVSALMIGSYFVYYFLKNHRDLFLHFIGPCTVIIAFSYMYREYGRLENFYHTDGIFMNTAILRSIMGLTIGIYVYYISKRISWKDNKYSKAFKTIMEFLCFLGPIAFALFNEEGSYDFGFIIVFAIGILLASSNKTLGKVANIGFVRFMSDMSYAAYLAHFAVIILLSRFLNLTSIWHWWYIPLYFTSVITVAMIYGFCSNLLSSLAMKMIRY